MASDLTGMRLTSGGSEWRVTGPCDWNAAYWNIECLRTGKLSCRAGSLLLKLQQEIGKPAANGPPTV